MHIPCYTKNKTETHLHVYRVTIFKYAFKKVKTAVKVLAASEPAEGSVKRALIRPNHQFLITVGFKKLHFQQISR